MKALIICILLTIELVGLNSYSYAETGTGMPLKYISSCELDFNNDDKSDIALLMETNRDRELIVLLSTTSGYNACLVSKDKPNMYLSCHFGKTVKETSAGKGKEEGMIYRTNGTYLQLTQPEGSSVVYFWDGNGFKEIWTSD